jgi:predicted aldo/keto reductase-like oxidoreductase
VPCPQGIDIPEVFGMYNEAVGFGHDAESMAPYIEAYGEIDAGHRADACARCGNCEEKCPQHLAIRDILPKAHAALSGATTK